MSTEEPKDNNTSQTIPETKGDEVLLFPLEQAKENKPKESSAGKKEDESFSFSIDDDGEDFFIEDEPKFESDVSMVAQEQYNDSDDDDDQK